MSHGLLTQLLPLALAFIMLYLGTTLEPRDFSRVLARPRTLAIGLAGQTLMVPLLGLAVATVLHLDPVMAVGLMVLAAAPGGVSSGLVTHLARGDVALSITLTGVTSMIAALTLPLVVNAALHLFMPASTAIEFSMAHMIGRVFVLTTVPVVVGMLLRMWRPQAVKRADHLCGRVATALFVFIVFATFWDQRQVLMTHMAGVGPAALLLNASVLAGAWGLSQYFSLTAAERSAIVTECGLQNSALGIYVCIELLQSPAMSVPSVVYALLMNGGALAFVAIARKQLPHPTHP